MTRKSLRELENLLDDLRNDDRSGEQTRAVSGISAPFIKFKDEDPPEAPEGWTVRTEEHDHATFHVVERQDEEDEEEGGGE